MKTFEKFLVESSKQYKSLGDNTGKIDTKKGPGNILSDIEQKQFVKNEKSKKQVLRNLETQNKVKKNVIPDSKPPVTRFDPTEPFMDDDLGQRTGKTGDKVVNKPTTQTGKVVLGPDGKPLAYKGKNIPVASSTPGSTQLTGVKDSDLESIARGQETQAKRNLQTPKVDNKPKINTVKTDTVKTKNVVKKGPSKKYLELQKKARGILKDLKKEKTADDLVANQKTTIKPKIEKKFTTTQPSSATKNIGKNITTQTTSPKVVTKSFSDLGKDVKRATTQVTTGVGEVPKKVSPVKKILQRTGLTVDKTIKPENIGKSTKKIPKVTGNVVKAATKSSTKKALGKVFTGFGRAATGAVAVSDYLDTAKKEKAKGRGKTSQVVGGLSKALGGYIGGGIGAGLGGLAGGGVGSFATGTAGAIAGYELGSRAGEKLYNVGRQIVTGQKTFKQLRSDIVGASKDLKDKTVRTTKNLYNTGKKKVSDFIKDK